MLSPFLKIFLQIFFESVLDKILPPFAYMTTYVELLVRYAELMKIKVAEGFFESMKLFLKNCSPSLIVGERG